MNRLIENILARLAGASGATEVTPVYRPLFGPWITPILFIAIVVTAIWMYRARGVELTQRKRAFLFGLRIIAILCLVPILWEAGIRVTTTDPVKPVLALAVDTSQSMTIRDRYTSPESQAAITKAIGGAGGGLVLDRIDRFDLARRMLAAPSIGFASRVLEQAGLQVYGFDSTLYGGGPIAGSSVLSTTPSGEQTSISGCINSIIDALRGQPLAGIVLMTDGQHNSGESPVEAAPRWARQNARIIPVVIGDPEPRDIEVRQVIADPLMFRGDPATIYARVRHRGYDGETVSIILRSGEKDLTDVKITLSPEEREQTVAITFTPEQPGEAVFHVRCPVQADEIVEDNNEKVFNGRVTDDKIKILYIEDEPRWQYRFLKDAMLRDHRLKVDILLLRSERRVQPEPPFIAFLPTDRESFMRYDLILLGDVPRSTFSDEQLEWIRDLVADEGAGILFMAGPRSMPWTFYGSPIAPMTPVDFSPLSEDRGMRPVRKEEDRFRLQLTPEGLAHPVMALGSGYEENMSIWDQTPEMFWFASVRRARPGAMVLAAHPRERVEDRPLTLVAEQPYGRGRSFYIGIDESWRWRFKEGDRVFYHWWGQIIQYLGAPHLTGAARKLEVKTDRPRYARGESALVTVRMANVQDYEGRTWFAVAEDSQGNRTRIPLKRSEASDRLLEGRLALMRSGVQRISLEGAEAEASALIEVEAPRAEFLEPAANLQMMREVAGLTNGFVIRPEEFPDLVNRLDLKPVEVQTQRETLLWDRNWLIILFTLAVGLEWIFRRLGQLP